MLELRSRSSWVVLGIAVAWLGGTATAAAAADGALDTAFADGGSSYWEIVNGFFVWDVEPAAVVPADRQLIVVATRTLTESHLAFRAYDPEGDSPDALACDDSTGQIFPFGVTSRALAAGLSDSGQLLVAGALSFQGSEATERAFVAQFDLEAGGCTLDPAFASVGFAFYDDFSFCDTESCSVLGLAAMRRPTLAVSATRLLLLVRSEVGGPKGRLFLVGLTANGAVDNGFDGNGVLEILAVGTDGFYGDAHLALDARGRIYVLAAPFKEGGVTDTDLYLFRYLPGGGLDTGFAGDGILPLVTSTATDSTAGDLRVASDGAVVVSGGTIGGVSAFLRVLSPTGATVAASTEALLPAEVAPQGDGLLVTNAEFLPEGGDGMRSHRRELTTSATLPLDSSWGSQGTADHDFDYDPGSIEGDQPQLLELWGGRPVIVGRAANATRDVTFVLRLQNHYLFADGFEQGRAALWSSVVTP